ncbi:UMP kinase [Patescibacteria group bacterium]
MKYKTKEKFIIALGGSIAFPKEIDVDFLRKFYLFIKKEAKKGNKFIIICGGGYVTRKYQRSASKITKVLNEDKDWIGIHNTRLNAHFLRTIFRKESNPVVFDSRFKIKKFGTYSIIIGSGWNPGRSTDFVAVRIAADFNIKKVIILGKPDYVYTADFEKDKNAKHIKEINWKDYFNLIPSQWTPGLNTPVDPIAAKLAQKEKIKVIVANGKDLLNFNKILKGKGFKGTTLY